MTRKTDWFLITCITMLIAIFGAAGFVSMERAECMTDDECECGANCLE